MSAFFLFLCAFLLEIPTAHFSRQIGKRDGASNLEFKALARNASSHNGVNPMVRKCVSQVFLSSTRWWWIFGWRGQPWIVTLNIYRSVKYSFFDNWTDTSWQGLKLKKTITMLVSTWVFFPVTTFWPWLPSPDHTLIEDKHAQSVLHLLKKRADICS